MKLPHSLALYLVIPLLAVPTLVEAAPRIDNVLIRMVPPGVTSLVGVHMDQVIVSDLYQKLIAQQKLPQLDQFVKETGFDPRRDVRELLYIYVPSGSVLVARGKFVMKSDPAPGMKIVRHGEYNIHAQDASGFCILDSTLAAAGELPALEAALDEWTGGSHDSAQALLKPVAAINEQIPVWGVSTGFASFLASSLPRAGNGLDFSAIFKGIESSWFTLSVSSGLQAAIHCTAATEKDAVGLRDTTKGLIGLGRLMVPQDKPDLVHLWDGLTVEQDGRSFTLNADISGSGIDQLVQLFSNASGRGGRGGSGRGGRGGSGRGGAGRGVLPPGRA